MYTVLPAPGKFLQIQICPTFLTWALPAANPWTVTLSSTYWIKLFVGLVKQIAIATLFTPIDGFSLVDKMLVHEVIAS
jgi:hypothetical protein